MISGPRPRTRRGADRSVRVWAATLALVACHGETSPAAPPAPPSIASPQAWASGHPLLRDASEACQLEEIDERWERRGARCVHSRSVRCLRGGWDGKLAGYCSALGYGPVETRRFKIDHTMSCSGKAGGIVVAYPWRTVTFRLDLDTACEAIEPAWVAVQEANVHKLLGQLGGSPVAASWSRHWGESVSDAWELEWASGAIEESTLAAGLQDLGVPRVTRSASSEVWSTREPGHYSFSISTDGYRDNHLVIARWCPVKRREGSQPERWPPEDAHRTLAPAPLGCPSD